MNLIQKYITRYSRSSSLHGMMIMLIALTLSSCINEDLKEPETKRSRKVNFYIALQITAPSLNDTRSETLPNGTTGSTLTGKTNENIINSAHLFFFDESAGNKGDLLCDFVTSLSKPYPVIEGSNGSYTLTARVELDELRKLMGKKVNLYVVANQTSTSEAASGSDEEKLVNGSFSIADLSSDASKAFGTGPNGQYCPMSSQSEFTIDLENINNNGLSDYDFLTELLALFKQDYKKGTPDEGILWEIKDTNGNGSPGVLKLERSIARVDYADLRSGNEYAKNVFKLNNAEGEVYLKVVSMELFNLEKDAYTFRHTSDGILTEATTSTVAPFGIENFDENGQTYRWFAGVNWGKSPELFNHMIRETNEDETTWSFSPEYTDAYITTAELDQWILTNNKEETDYVPWFYVMENTVPKVNDMTLENCTGVQFRMLVCKDSKGTAVTGNSSTPYRIVLGSGAGDLEGYYQDIEYSEGKVINDLPIEPAGYYLSYKYLIEHNNKISTSADGNNPSVDGNTGKKKDPAPMQIGIVRNNVYQLSITSISSLPQPHEPDNMILEVECVVADWDVRNDDNITLF